MTQLTPVTIPQTVVTVKNLSPVKVISPVASKSLVVTGGLKGNPGDKGKPGTDGRDGVDGEASLGGVIFEATGPLKEGDVPYFNGQKWVNWPEPYLTDGGNF